MRPRDIISFVNNCLSEADDKNIVTKEDIIRAEKEYSQLRYQALLDEWKLLYPNLGVIMSILKEKPDEFKIADISDTVLDDFLVQLTDVAEDKRGSICQKAISLIKESNLDRQARENFLKCIFAVLYHIGAVGIKFIETDKIRYSHSDRLLIEDNDISADSLIHVAKMLYGAMDIKSRCRKKYGKIPAYLF